MSRSLRAISLVLLLLISLLVSAPARLLGLVLPSGELLMEGFSGTLWRGKANRCLVRTDVGYLHLGAVEWRLRPFSLLLFAPRVTIESHWGSQTLATGLIVRGGGDLDLYELEANVPADLLRQFVPVSLTGNFFVQLNQLKLRAGTPVEGDGRLVWQDGGWISPTGPVPLGSYGLDFSQGEGAPLDAGVITIAGAVNAEGSVQIQDRAYRIDIMITGEEVLDTRLQQALSLMARPVGQGFQVKLDGEF